MSKFKNIIGKTVNCLKNVGYNLDIMRQTACIHD